MKANVPKEIKLLCQKYDILTPYLTGYCFEQTQFWKVIGQAEIVLQLVLSPGQRLYRKACILEDLQPVKPVTYSAIKESLVGLTRYLATYWAENGVRAKALLPVGVYNDLGEDLWADSVHLYRWAVWLPKMNIAQRFSIYARTLQPI